MSTYLLCGDAMVRMPSARIPRENVTAIRDSVALLEEARMRRENAEAEIARARADAQDAARGDALDEMRAALALAIVDLEQGFRRENARRERDTAAAALDVLQHLIGERGNAAVVTGLARQALARSGGGDARLRVSADLADAVREALSGREDVEVVADPFLPLLACRIDTAEGRIIADLDLQIRTLRERWGIDGGPNDE